MKELRDLKHLMKYTENKTDLRVLGGVGQQRHLAVLAACPLLLLLVRVSVRLHAG